MRIALATQADLWATEVDDAPLHDALRRLGWQVETPVWDDPSVDWARYDVVTPRTTWDYVPKITTFTLWLRRVDAVTRLVNSGATMLWNLDKVYLRSLEHLGVPCVPTRWISGPSDLALEGWIEAGELAFLKPAVGAGASGTLRFRHDAEGLEAARVHVGQGGRFLLQPYLRTIEDQGERSAILFDGEPAFAVRKLPPSGDYRVQDEQGGTDEPWAMSRAEADLVDEVRRAMATLVPDARYARVDWLIDEVGQPRLCELELVEPSLFFRHGPGAAERFAQILVDSSR